jgi:integrase
VKRRGDRWEVRFVYADPVSGKYRELRRKVESKVAGHDLLREFERSVSHGSDGFAGRERRTFNDLADYYAKNYARPAEYSEGRKVFGLRSYKAALGYVKILRQQFGERKLRTLTYGDILGFKVMLMHKPTRTGTKRSMSNVNRALSLLRRLLNIAYREGWIDRSPFSAGESLISAAGEKRRERILSPEEEARLLKALEHPRRVHARPIVICALDTGMRRGEILKLRWCDVDLDEEIITIEALHTKTLTKRQVAITSRLRHAIEVIRAAGPKAAPDELVFGVRCDLKHSFHAALRDANIDDLHFHDLRHTAATRLVQGHLPLAEVGRILGHADPKTTYRYVNADSSTLTRGRDILEVFATKNENLAAVGSTGPGN